MNVLITGASRKVSLVRAFQSALMRSRGGHVIAVDVSPYAPALYFADRRFQVPPSTEPGFIEELLNICGREKVALIVPTRDEELPLFAESRGRFEQAGMRVMVPAPETVNICRDKAAFLAFCRRHAFGIPRTYDRQEWRRSDFPLFAKPRFGKGGYGAHRVTREEELRHAIDHPDEWVIQEYMPWPEYTVDLLADFEGRVLSAVPRLRQLVVGGESYVSRTVHEPALIAEAARLATALHLVGHNTIQCFWDGKQAKFVEVNPRFGGAAALGIAAGVDTPAMLIRMVNGETLPTRLGQFDEGLVMLRYTEDLFLKAGDLMPATANQSAIAEIPLECDREIRAVLFDLDNTLYPEREFVNSGFRAAAQCLAKDQHLDAEALLEQMLDILRTHGRGKVFDILLKKLKLDSGSWLRTLLLVYRSHRPVISLAPETAIMLRALKDGGLRLGLVTDGMASMQRRKIGALGLDAYMDAVVCTDELGAGFAKPSRVPFEVALTLLGVPPKAAVYIADDPSKDFAGPNQLGMKSMQVVSPGLLGVRDKPIPNDPAFRPKMTSESLTEAVKLLGLL